MSVTGTYENLLLVTDGSDFSEGAVREALRLAKQCAGKVTVLTVVEFNPEFAALAPDAVDKMEADARAMVDSIKGRAEKEGVTCDSLVVRGINPHEQIVEEAGKLKADAIMMGRRGRTGIKRLLMGSVTARVIGHSPVKVFVVPKNAELKFGKILVATDGSKYSEAAAVEAVGLAKCSGGNVIAISVAEDEKGMDAAKANVTHMEEVARKQDVKADKVCEKGKAPDIIVDTARQEGCDLIVVGSHGRTGLSRLLMGSTAERVVGHADCAVLVVKSER